MKSEKMCFGCFPIAGGAVPSAFDCYLVNRGLKTLHVRMKEHQKNAFAVAKFLEGNENVEKVLHPGLPSHPDYELAKKQMRGFCGMVTFYIKGGLDEASTFLKNIKVLYLRNCFFFGLFFYIIAGTWNMFWQLHIIFIFFNDYRSQPLAPFTVIWQLYIRQE